MPRPLRTSLAGECYHVLNCGNGRAEVFHEEEDYAVFVRLMAEACERVPMRVHKTCPGFKDFAWPEGYTVFSVSNSAEVDVKAYIANQIEHHACRGFDGELLAILRAHKIEFDPRYVFD